MSASIAHVEWLKDPDLQKLLSVLDHDDARLVGGCVRNALMNKDTTDIDIATKHEPQKTLELLEAADIRAIPTGLDHGTITAVIDHKSFEVTTLRQDVETDGRHAVVSFTTSWEEDAKRRDFTMNTLLAGADGNVHDPTGHGIKHLEAGQVIFVGNPEQRIQEDYLRILRFFRFHAYYGSGEPDKHALEACAKYAEKIETLSKERITQEFLKILAADKADEILTLMHNHGVMMEYGIQDFDMNALNRVMDVRTKLAVICGYDIQVFEDLVEKLSLSNAQVNFAQQVIKAMSYDYKNDHDLKLALYHFGRDVSIQACLAKQDTAEQVEKLGTFEIPVLPVTGQDLLDKGYKAGPEIGQKLREIEAAWIENGFKLPDQES